MTGTMLKFPAPIALLFFALLLMPACSDPPGFQCTPQCTNLECGPDGCGGTCGDCPGGLVCLEGICGACVPDCFGQVCGPDGCGGSCGECPANSVCGVGGCSACNPNCTGVTCGDDGCGGSCGACDSNEICSEGQCVSCVPDCLGKTCGDNGCGSPCGECAPGTSCESGSCVTCSPQCAGIACGDDGCNGTCGTCAPGSLCEAGQCVECTPQCEGLQCGDDLCGGVCGECPPGVACTDGACGGCAPTCIGKPCFASDGCGGTCWNCPLDDPALTTSRAAYAAGMKTGQDLYAASLEAVLVDQGFSANHAGTLTAEAEAFSGLSRPIEDCPFVALVDNLQEAPPPPCAFLAGFARAQAYSALTPHLSANPLPADLAALDTDGDLAFQYEKGANFGIERYRVALMWDMKAKGTCDAPLSPVTASHEKGLLIGMHAVGQAFNNWLSAQGLVADLPAWENALQICAPDDGIDAAWKSQAVTLFENLVAAHSTCPGYAPPSPELETAFAEAETLFAAGLEEGMAAETLLIEGRLRALVPCGSITE